MAAMDFKPEFTVFKKESDAFTTITENRDLIRKNDTRRLHGNRTDAPAHPRAETQKTEPAVSSILAWMSTTFP
jgi:toxic protein SymE